DKKTPGWARIPIMPLLSFWKSNRDEVLKLTIEQVVSNAGDGNLKDHNACSDELRKFLETVPSDQIFRYARHCLEVPFNKSGFVLQDIVNELGRRLDFEVESGLYQGKPKVVGFDGIWRHKDQPNLIVEAKTTDQMSFSLDKLAEFKEKLATDSKVSRNSSTLIVVGREDTGALEAQVRGSRYAWEMRLISLESLIKLVQVKEKSDDSGTILQIRQLLQPFEYTKIDRIIDVIFTTAVDLESGEGTEQEGPEAPDGSEDYKQIRTAPELLNAKRQQAVDAFAAVKGNEIVKRSRTLFWSTDKALRACCAVSKRYEGEYQPYWYAFHPKWDEFLAEGKEGYFILACMDRDEAFAVPYSWILKNKNNLSRTEKGDRSYWHVPITTLSGGTLAINMSRIGTKASLEPYRFDLKKT
ncbi:MAG TPA: hypothetical protein VI685_23020, partial [Candidatus Angelobacter sp.]